MMLARFFLTALLLALAAPEALAQTVQQSGSVTAGHMPYWVTSGILADGGAASGTTTKRITELGITKNGGNALCVNSDVTTAAGRTQLCIGTGTSSAGTITMQNYGTATPQPLELVINGTTISFGTGSGTGASGWLSPIIDQQIGNVVGDLLCRGTNGWQVLPVGANGNYMQSVGTSGCPTWTSTAPALGAGRLVASGTTDTATTADVTIGWTSATTSAKTQTIYACNSGVPFRTLIIKDAIGTAATYPLSVVPAAGTIDNATKVVLNFNLWAVTLICDGVSNWMVM